ncbi:hypothetical protein EYZ11_012071 [Aspergillus tanneri]|uniref:Uncharacterized protein n=1 Tax=Aspergillus tanneri TaxID=1220188 RepID=A0A4S3J6J5_9EURO|nr:hypothetical protein EYZ11_012071 [Aspergillus tanneri]
MPFGTFPDSALDPWRLNFAPSKPLQCRSAGVLPGEPIDDGGLLQEHWGKTTPMASEERFGDMQEIEGTILCLCRMRCRTATAL